LGEVGKTSGKCPTGGGVTPTFRRGEVQNSSPPLKQKFGKVGCAQVPHKGGGVSAQSEKKNVSNDGTE